MKRMLAMLSFFPLLLGSCSGNGGEKEFSIQLYSVRELIGNPELYAENHVQVLSELAGMGYTGVEAACYNDGLLYGVSPEQFKADIEAAGLKPLSSHVSLALSENALMTGDFSVELAWWDKCIAAHKAAGMSYLVMPWFPVPAELDALKRYCDYFNEIGRRCNEQGLRFGYHNHSHEFNKIGDKVVYDFILENTDPELVFMQMDVYWAVMGRVSPVEYFKKYPGRFELLHIKDYSALGQSGMVGFDAIFNNFELSGTRDIVVEIEFSTCGDIMQSCRESADYLKAAEFVK